MWEKRKLLVKSNFCFPTFFSISMYCKHVNLFPNKPWFFTCLLQKPFENTLGKGEIARNKQFLLFPQCFYLLEKLSAIFIKSKIVVSQCFEFGRVKKLSFGKGLKTRRAINCHISPNESSWSFAKHG